MNVNVNTDVSSLTRSRINEVLLRHADTKSLILPGGQIRILTVNPLLQNGPQCGLVALSMAIQLLGFSNKDVSEIFEMAKLFSFSTRTTALYVKKGSKYSLNWFIKQIVSNLVDN
ncbi:hypothetical protein DICVIV_09780 [Dictyocaulus viviparus]|uniref:Uncharacterized protein n=1 Tax=Dictyocaulus viviparus TaxID=29172 RepID=A0A0D8XHY3_DICVI|nr:hypothetical protein DICVIV_09780 [Dictyocaulus viviparus]